MAGEEYSPEEEKRNIIANLYAGGYPSMGSAVGNMNLGSLRIPSVRKMIEVQIAELEMQLAERRSLIAQLDEHPQVERLLDTLRRLGL